MGNNSESIKQMVEQLYTDRDQSGDAVFVVESEQIRAHRSVLAALSPKYKAQFYGPNPDQGEIRVPNVSAAAFKKFIQFFYKESVDLTMDNIKTVLDLVRQSLVDGFVEICIDFLKKSITSNNVCFVYRLAVLYDIETLRLDCQRQISSKTLEVFESEGFMQCDRDILLQILQLDELNCSEKNVFDAGIAWARADCKRKALDEQSPKHLRELLGEAIYQIRFASMNVEEFAILNNSMVNFFAADELSELFCVTTKLKDFTPKIFSSTPRVSSNQSMELGGWETFSGSPTWSLECNRFKNMSKKHDNIFRLDWFLVLCDQPIRFHGFALSICLDGLIDNIFSFSASIERPDNGLSEEIQSKCKLYRSPHRKNETIFILENPIEGMICVQCALKLPKLQLNYEVILNNVVKVNDIEFNVCGQWVSRIFFDEN